MKTFNLSLPKVNFLLRSEKGVRDCFCATLISSTFTVEIRNKNLVMFVI